ncbi:MAG: hypothetical protein AB7P02_05110 [Alphaproteobacteria bacterium]
MSAVTNGVHVLVTLSSSLAGFALAAHGIGVIASVAGALSLHFGLHAIAWAISESREP